MTALDKKSRNRLTKYGITIEQYEQQELLGNLWCCGCKRFLSKDLFVPSMRVRANGGTICRACRKIYTQAYNLKNKTRINARQRVYTAANREVARQRSREYWNNLSPEERKVRAFRAALKLRYGLTPETYDAMLARQGGGCAICGNAKGNGCLCVDHDHRCCPGRKSCGKCLRGIICGRCNTLIGVIEKNHDLIPACEAYLSGSPDS